MGEERIIPPPPRARHRESSILDELPPALGIVLWQDARHLRDWAESTWDVRAGLFNPDPPVHVLAKRRDAIACAGELAEALGTLGELRVAPLTTDPGELGEACAAISGWALERGHVQTAIEFAEAAALVVPESASLANLAGRVTRGANEYDRAEIWFRRAIGYARNQDDKVELTRAHLGFGTLCKELGRVNGARKHLNSGSSLARKYGPPSLAAEAQHDLCALLIVNGRFAEAEKRARRALRLYPKTHHRLPFFAADVALLLVLEERFTSAVGVLEGILRILTQPTARAVILALTARALAGAGRIDEATLYRDRATKLVEKNPGLEGVARWHLADSHRLAGEWDAAEREADAALEIAARHDDHELARLTRNLMDLIRDQLGARPAPPDEGDAHHFVQLLTRRLAEWVPRRARVTGGPWGSEWVA
jgi:tetratricopeptide (TPR) repeat protein